MFYLPPSGDTHKAMKKLMSPAFSNSHLAQREWSLHNVKKHSCSPFPGMLFAVVPMFYAPIVSCIELMNKEIDEAEQGDEKKTESKVIDMYPLMSRTTVCVLPLSAPPSALMGIFASSSTSSVIPALDTNAIPCTTLTTSWLKLTKPWCRFKTVSCCKIHSHL